VAHQWTHQSASASTEAREADVSPSDSSPGKIHDRTASSTQTKESYEAGGLSSSWLKDEKQVEKALQKIIDYVENAGEITQLQKSLIGLHQSLLDRSNDTATIDRRLSLVSASRGITASFNAQLCPSARAGRLYPTLIPPPNDDDDDDDHNDLDDDEHPQMLSNSNLSLSC
jgi:hypothetical protein